MLVGKWRWGLTKLQKCHSNVLFGNDDSVPRYPFFWTEVECPADVDGGRALTALYDDVVSDVENLETLTGGNDSVDGDIIYGPKSLL